MVGQGRGLCHAPTSHHDWAAGWVWGALPCSQLMQDGQCGCLHNGFRALVQR